jgi:hypothetical protein
MSLIHFNKSPLHVGIFLFRPVYEIDCHPDNGINAYVWNL